MDNAQKAKFYDQLLREYDEIARQVSLINSKFDLSKEDQKQIESLKKEMDLLQRKAMSLGSL
jgi:cell shape-determining protein MreC